MQTELSWSCRVTIVQVPLQGMYNSACLGMEYCSVVGCLPGMSQMSWLPCKATHTHVHGKKKNRCEVRAAYDWQRTNRMHSPGKYQVTPTWQYLLGSQKEVHMQRMHSVLPADFPVGKASGDLEEVSVPICCILLSSYPGLPSAGVTGVWEGHAHLSGVLCGAKE